MCDDPPLEDEELRSEPEEVKDIVEYVEDLEEANPEFPIDTEGSDSLNTPGVKLDRLTDL